MSVESATPMVSKSARTTIYLLLALTAAIIVVSVLVWQAVTAGGDPDPLAEGITPTAAVMNTGVVVFREGLEAILVLAALTASMVRRKQDYWKPIVLGAGVSFLATIATWFLVVSMIDSINAPAKHVQAATGVLAIVVLLVIMNWFFHKVYWGGWIRFHEKRKRAIIEAPTKGPGSLSENGVFWGLFFVGLTAVYREGFEIVLFLQNWRLQAGNAPVLAGTAIGLSLTAMVAFLTFVAQKKLPFRQLLIATGIMLGGVLLIMVGASSDILQHAGWIPTTKLDLPIPAWVSGWFGIYPTVEGLAAQSLVALFIIGSYFMAKHKRKRQDIESEAPDAPVSAASVPE